MVNISVDPDKRILEKKNMNVKPDDYQSIPVFWESFQF